MQRQLEDCIAAPNSSNFVSYLSRTLKTEGSGPCTDEEQWPTEELADRQSERLGSTRKIL